MFILFRPKFKIVIILDIKPKKCIIDFLIGVYFVKLSGIAFEKKNYIFFI